MGFMVAPSRCGIVLHDRFLRMSDGTAPPRPRLTKTTGDSSVAAGTIAVVVAVFVFFLPRIADYREVLDVLRGLGGRTGSCWSERRAQSRTFPPPWMAALPGLGFRQASR